MPLQGSRNDKERLTVCAQKHRLPAFCRLRDKGIYSPAAAIQFKKFLQVFLNGSDLPPDLLLLMKGLIAWTGSYIGELALFAMYVCTASVHTYIARTPKRTIYAILYVTKVLISQAHRFDQVAMVR